MFLIVKIWWTNSIMIELAYLKKGMNSPWNQNIALWKLNHFMLILV